MDSIKMNTSFSLQHSFFWGISFNLWVSLEIIISTCQQPDSREATHRFRTTNNAKSNPACNCSTYFKNGFLVPFFLSTFHQQRYPEFQRWFQANDIINTRFEFHIWMSTRSPIFRDSNQIFLFFFQRLIDLLGWKCGRSQRKWKICC
jgi:hypothetical protein